MRWLRQRAADEHVHLCGPSDAPKLRRDFLQLVFCLWGITGVAFLVATIIGIGPVWLIFGERAGQVAAIPGLAACWFCLAGAPYASWRRHYASRAGRRAKKHGLEDPRVQQAMRRSVPRNDSIIWQAAVALVITWSYIAGLS